MSDVRTLLKKRPLLFDGGMGTYYKGAPGRECEQANRLDPEGIRTVRTFLRRYADAGNTVLLSSHLMGETAETVDDIVIINKARIIATGTLAEITDGHASLEEAFFALTGSEPGESW